MSSTGPVLTIINCEILPTVPCVRHEPSPGLESHPIELLSLVDTAISDCSLIPTHVCNTVGLRPTLYV
jgi:hypothetical protein